MKHSGETPDDFERMLGAALDPGEIDLSAAEKAELLATAEFMTLLARELDPGEIEFEPAERKGLVERLSTAVKEDDLTAWALGELPVERCPPLEARMEGDEDLRSEGLAIRNFCHRAELLLPPVGAPGWWERRRLRRIFSAPAPGRRVAGFATAAAAMVALSVALLQRPGSPELPVAAGVALPVPREKAVAGQTSMGPPEPALVTLRPGLVERADRAGVATRSSPARTRQPSEGIWIANPVEEAPVEPAFVFTANPARPVLRPAPGETAPDLEQLLAVNLKVRAEGPPISTQALATEQASAAGFLASLDGVGPMNTPRMTGGSRDLVTAAKAISGLGNVDPDPDPDAGHDADPRGGGLAAATPEAGSLILSQSQPYLLSALLRGPVSGRPDGSRTGDGGWLSADFQAMDFNLPSGKGGVESDSWRIEAGMSWLLSPSWQAGVSLAGIESRMEVPGFGAVDAEGAAISWSLDWRENGYHAALTHTLGTFDQDLRRQASGMLYPAGQDATVQLLSLWVTREFEAGCWTHGPVAGVEGSWGSLEGYQEPFAGGVSVAGRDFGLMTSLVGWQIAGRYETSAGDWLPHAVLGWRHRSILAEAGMAQGGPAGNFVVPPVSPERDSLLLEGGLRWVPPSGSLFFDAVSSTEWRDGGDSENSLLFKFGISF